MAAMFAKLVLLLCVTSTFGHMVREYRVPGNQEAQDLDSNTPLPKQHDLDPENLRQQWQDLVNVVNRKIDERINQLEVNLASQKTEIKQLKQEALDKDEVIDMLVTKVTDLEKIVIVKNDRDERALPPIATSQFPNTENSENRLHFGNTSETSSRFSPADMSTPQATVAEISNYQNISSIQNNSEQQTRLDDVSLPKHEGNTVNNGPDDSLTVKLQRFRQKRVAPRATIAFHTALSNRKTVTNDEVVAYDQEMLDQGDGYQPKEGLYIAPECGTYVLTWTTLCSAHEKIQTLLEVNGAVRGSSWTNAEEINDIHQSTAVVVLTLNQGDRVFIRMGHTYGQGTIVSLSAVAVSTFSGWKLD